MGYTIDEKSIERQYMLGEHLNKLTLHAIQNVFLQPEAKILDVGCGIGESSGALAACFPGSYVTGLEQDERLLEVARSRQQKEKANIDFIKGDALMLPFESNRFDFVFTRYLLMHLESPLLVLNEMKRVCKPGGMICAQEPDACLLYCYPASWGYDKLRNWFQLLFPDALIGRKLESYFKATGLNDISIQASLPFEMTDNNILKRLYRLTGEAMRSSLMNSSIISEPEYTKCIQELARVENDPNTFLLGNPSMLAMGIVASE